MNGRPPTPPDLKFPPRDDTVPAASPPNIPDYHLLRRIGSGSYGDVWLARNVLGQFRAVKIIYRHRFADPRPFDREFEGIRRFEPISRSHPSQLHILHVGKNDAAGCFYYVMELADDGSAVAADVRRPPASKGSDPEPPDVGAYRPRTLRHDLEHRGRLPIPECIQIGLSLATALQHLHEQGLVHRDIKPSNIIFVGGVAKLGDIGLVTEAGDTQSIVGTEGYLPPEGPGTPQADLFSLGKVLYEISSGLDRRRFPSLPEDCWEWSDGEAVMEFDEVVLKACAKDPAQRYGSVDAMREEMESLRKGRSLRQERAQSARMQLARKLILITLVIGVLALVWVSVIRSNTEVYDHSSIAEVNTLVEQGNLCLQSGTPERLNTAEVLFEKALALDRKFVPAQFGKWIIAVKKVSAYNDAPTAARDELHAARGRLMELAPNSAEAWAANAYGLSNDGDWRRAIDAARRATQSKARCQYGRAHAAFVYGYCLDCLGYLDAGLEQFRHAEGIYPSDPAIQMQLGLPCFARRQFDLATKQFDRTTELEPRFLGGGFWKARVFEETGEFEKAIDEWERYDSFQGRRREGDFYPALRAAVRRGGAEGYWVLHLERARRDGGGSDHYQVARFLARLGRDEEGYRELAIALANKQVHPGNLVFDLCWDRRDPRFKSIAAKLGMNPEF